MNSSKLAFSKHCNEDDNNDDSDDEACACAARLKRVWPVPTADVSDAAAADVDDYMDAARRLNRRR
jgi:hypothetical protein